jgi:PKD domain
MLMRRRSFALTLVASVFATTAAARALGVTDSPRIGHSPGFVVPTAVHQGESVGFDASRAAAVSSPNPAYVWEFGDGVAARGPNVVHTYARAGNYRVKLIVTSPGGNVSSLSHTVAVLEPSGQPVTAPLAPPSAASTRNPRVARDAGLNAPLSVRLVLLPQDLKTALRSGIAVNVTSNASAAGFASVLISRGVAKQTGIKASSAPSVLIGMGTIAGITAGTKKLHLLLSQAISSKLGRLQHVTLTIRLALVAGSGDQVTVDAAGHY